MHNDYLYYLLNKQAGGAISPEEEMILEKWYQSLQYSIPVTAEEMETDKQLAWEALKPPLSQSTEMPDETIAAPVRTLLKPWPVAAAILVLIAGMAALGIFLNRRSSDKPISYTIVQTQRQQKSVTLPDGSKVWVNAHSKIRFANSFDNNRNIILEYGEAYFDVAKDPHHAFMVQVNDLKVEVLGTAFNIQAFPQLGEIKVAVTNGKVAVNDSLQCHENLMRDQVLTYSLNNHRYSINTIDPAKANDWKNGRIYLNNISLKELAVYIRNVYDYDVVFVNEDLAKCKNTINFRDKDPLKEVLELLKLINHVKYSIRNKTIYLDGEGCL